MSLLHLTSELSVGQRSTAVVIVEVSITVLTSAGPRSIISKKFPRMTSRLFEV